MIDGTKAAARWRKEVAMRTMTAFGDGFMLSNQAEQSDDTHTDRLKICCVVLSKCRNSPDIVVDSCDYFGVLLFVLLGLGIGDCLLGIWY